MEFPFYFHTVFQITSYQYQPYAKLMVIVIQFGVRMAVKSLVESLGTRCMTTQNS